MKMKLACKGRNEYGVIWTVNISQSVFLILKTVVISNIETENNAQVPE